MKPHFIRIYLNFIFSLLPIFCFKINAQTNVSGGIFNNTTWTKSKSPYIVTDNIVVLQDVTLTIEPGVEIKFNDDIGIDLRGKLRAIGTSLDSISITSNSSTPKVAIWKGIKAYSSPADPIGIGEQIIMKFCKVSYANYFIDLEESHTGPYTFSNCKFSYNERANNYLGEGGIYFTECLFEYNSNGPTGYHGGTVIDNNGIVEHNYTDGWVKHSIFKKNGIGINNFPNVDYCTFEENNTAGLAYGSVTNCIIKNNYQGLNIVQFNGANNNIKNNIITDNYFGIILKGGNVPGKTTIINNKICNNTYNVNNVYFSNSNLSNNCFCTDNEAEIETKILDAKDNLSYGLVIYTPQNCELYEYNYSISGIVHRGTDFMVHGTVKAFNITTTQEFSIETNDNGEFSLNALTKGHYKLLAIPNTDNYLATYYPNKISESDAVVFDLEGQITDVDIYLQQLSTSIEEGGLQKTVSISPNPFTDHIEVRGDDVIIIKDIRGVIHFQGKVQNNNINTYEWKPGMYFLSTKDGHVVKIIKTL